MTNEELTSDAAATASTAASRAVTIKRDATFVRIKADDVLVLSHRADIQLALIAVGPDPVAVAFPEQEDEQEARQVKLQASYTELARVTMPATEAVNAAMLILQRAIEKDLLDLPALQTVIASMIEKYGVPEEPASSDAEAQSE